jgi:hypothetical protein
MGTMERDEDFVERRETERRPANIRAKYRNLNDFQFANGVIRNLSERGFLLEGQKYEPAQERIQVLTVDVPNEQMIQATARVAWSREAKALRADKVEDAFLIGLEVIEKAVV